MRYRRVLPFLLSTAVLLLSCNDDIPGQTPNAPSDTAEPEVTDLPPEVSDVSDTAEGDVTGRDVTDLDVATEDLSEVDTALPVSDHHFVGAVVGAAGIHSDDEGDFTVYGTLGCLSGCSAQMQNEFGDFNIVSFGGGYR